MTGRQTRDWIEIYSDRGQARLNRAAVARWLDVTADDLRSDLRAAVIRSMCVIMYTLYKRLVSFPRHQCLLHALQFPMTQFTVEHEHTNTPKSTCMQYNIIHRHIAHDVTQHVELFSLRTSFSLNEVVFTRSLVSKLM